MNIVHIAIPTHDLELATAFYTSLGAEPARRYHDRQTFRWFSHQLVCHCFPERVKITGEPLNYCYPRHFGITFDNEKDFETIRELCVASGAKHIQEVSIRFADLPERHKTFFMADPSENILEFKWYYDQQYAY
jgi:extradiol dioxygenase family protein